MDWGKSAAKLMEPTYPYRVKQDVLIDGKVYEKVIRVHCNLKIIEPTLYSILSKIPPKWEGYHPITDNQKAIHGFKYRSIHKMRITQNDGSFTYVYVRINNESEYKSAKDLFGSYNITDSFNGQRFTKVLELEVL